MNCSSALHSFPWKACDSHGACIWSICQRTSSGTFRGRVWEFGLKEQGVLFGVEGKSQGNGHESRVQGGHIGVGMQILCRAHLAWGLGLQSWLYGVPAKP